MVEGDGTSAKENDGEGESGQGEGELVSAVTHESIVKVHLGDGDRHIDADGQGCNASEQAEQNEKAAKELGEGREVGGPGGEPEAGDELNMVVKSAEDLVVSVIDKHGAESEPHNEERERLQAIEVAQVSLLRERKID